MRSLAPSSHEAGRRMSRSRAKRAFSLADVACQTKHVECRKDPGIIGGRPGASRNIDPPMAPQRDLEEPVHTFTPVMCAKG